MRDNNDKQKCLLGKRGVTIEPIDEDSNPENNHDPKSKDPERTFKKNKSCYNEIDFYAKLDQTTSFHLEDDGEEVVIDNKRKKLKIADPLPQQKNQTQNPEKLDHSTFCEYFPADPAENLSLYLVGQERTNKFEDSEISVQNKSFDELRINNKKADSCKKPEKIAVKEIIEKAKKGDFKKNFGESECDRQKLNSTMVERQGFQIKSQTKNSPKSQKETIIDKILDRTDISIKGKRTIDKIVEFEKRKYEKMTECKEGVSVDELSLLKNSELDQCSNVGNLDDMDMDCFHFSKFFLFM